MTEPLARRIGPVRVLEIGPGTGAVTRTIVKHLQPGDRFDLVELNPAFVEILRRNFEDDADYRRTAGFSEIHACPLQEFQAESPYDYVISGLPLNNFPADLVRDIFASYFRLLKPQGVLSYFEYMYVRPARKLVTSGDEKARLIALDEIMGAYRARHHVRTDWVFANVPPAWVQHLRNNGEGSSERPA
jgi:phospholipid N-methyltransferase